MLIRVNTIESLWDNRVAPWDTTWEVFRAAILDGHQMAEDKSKAKLFNAVEYKPVDDLKSVPEASVYDKRSDISYTRRLAQNVLSVGMLVLDYDGELSLAEARERFKDFEYVAYTSFSHLREPGVERFRVVLPLVKPIPATGQFTDCDDLIGGSEWYELEDALKTFAGPCDPASFRCNQFFYLPVTETRRANTAQVWSNSGQLLDWTDWVRKPRQTYIVHKVNASEDRRSTTGHLDANQLLRTHAGTIRVRDVLGRVEGVWCPFHEDNNGSEFIKRIPHTDKVFLFCRRCNQTYWMTDGDHSTESENGSAPTPLRR